MVWTNVRFPEQTMILLTRNVKDFSGLGPYAFRVAPSMTKLEAKEYLEKIYGVHVAKIHSVNFLGKLVRVPGRKIYREPNYKKLFVYLEDPNKPQVQESTKEPIEKRKLLNYEGVHKEESQKIIDKRYHYNPKLE